MEDLRKINSTQLYLCWKNYATGIVVLIAVMLLTKFLPNYLAPIVDLSGVATLYYFIIKNKFSPNFSCIISLYALFVCLIASSALSIVLNILFAGHILAIPKEMIFISDPYIPTLLLFPVCFITMIFIAFRRKKLSICKECRLDHPDLHERGRFSTIINYESQFQLLSLLVIFGIISVVIWTYYIIFYQDINQNGRDWYVFIWFITIVLLLDILYFIFRYYNLYLDLKENNEIVAPEHLATMTNRIYLRYYVICDNYVYVNVHAIDPLEPYREIIDTPFFTKRSVTGITIEEVKTIIERMTGVENGELRFFFGRRTAVTNKQSILRYFYFLDGTIDDYPQLKTPGEWMDYELVKKIYSESPGRLAPISVVDTTRLATIMVTEKIYNEKGIRKSKIKSYLPTFNLIDVRNSNLDFQDDKWIRISMFNSDVKFFHLRLWWKRFSGRKNGHKPKWDV